MRSSSGLSTSTCFSTVLLSNRNTVVPSVLVRAQRHELTQDERLHWLPIFSCASTDQVLDDVVAWLSLSQFIEMGESLLLDSVDLFY
jgi:hypothetical protein